MKWLLPASAITPAIPEGTGRLADYFWLAHRHAPHPEDLALHAARSARLLLGSPPWAWEDWQDMTQEARIALWCTPAGADDSTRFVRARYAVMKAYLTRLVGHNPAATLPLEYAEQVEVVEADDAVRLHPEVAVALANLFLADRKQRQGRAVEAALRQVRIVDLLTQGYRNDAIALELGITVNDVKRARASIKASLAAHAVQAGRLTEAEADALTSARTADSYDRRWARRRYASHRAHKE